MSEVHGIFCWLRDVSGIGISDSLYYTLSNYTFPLFINLLGQLGGY
jgi:hypothetical protein